MGRELVDSRHKDVLSANDRAERERLAGMGRLGGALLVVAATASLASALTFDQSPPVWVLAVMALALATGICCLAAPWERISPRWLHAIPLLGTLEITAASWGAGMDGIVYTWLYLIVVLIVAYTFRSRAVVAGYLALVSACLSIPVAVPAITSANSVGNLLVALPTLAIAAVIVTYFREQLEAGKHTFQELSLLDPLTGVGNYRSLHERLDYEIARHERHQRCFAVMLLDLRRFKQVNEAHGHLEGDRVLSEVGRVLSSTVRDQDTVARHGGDEFSVLAPETTSAEVAALAARLQQALGTIRVDDRTLAASIGWAIYPGDGCTAEQLFSHADGQVRESKSKWSAPDPASPAQGMPAMGAARTLAQPR
jgi:diguanylate cyclase (GGDEF)-like protein